MASHCVMAVCVLTCMFFCTSLSATDYENVKLDLYYETLCPGCADFIVNDLPKIYENGLIDIVDLNLVPSGNTKLDSNGNVTCQHGEKECLLNKVEACVINLLPFEDMSFKIVHCIENWVIHGQNTPNWESCYKLAGFDPSAGIKNCSYSPLGKWLEVEYARETASLVPPHKFVPWVVVNDKPLEENYPKFMSAICDAYKGPKPKACKDPQPAVVSEVKKLEVKQVCPVEDITFLSVPAKSPMRFRKIKN